MTRISVIQIAFNFGKLLKNRFGIVTRANLHSTHYFLRNVGTSTVPAPTEDAPRVDEQFSFHLNRYTNRTHTCAQLRIDHVGVRVRICGWLQYKRLNKFLVLKDAYGAVQVLLKEGDVSEELPLESVLEVEGVVRARPATMRNPEMATGDVEIEVVRLHILNACRQKLPFFSTSPLKHGEAFERLRLEHRYLDLRNDRLQENLRFRSSLVMRMRQFLHDHSGFVEVETPTLFRRTPGGAREFIVPTEVPGHFFCLPQSPQQFKQLLMVGSIDRYFQIARCYRDEGTMRHRQPEFTQLDLEMSFTDREGVKSLVEELLAHSLPPSISPPSLPFPTMTYGEAMSRYGVDKPDLRFHIEIRDVTEILGRSGADVLTTGLDMGFRIKCLRIENGATSLSKSEWKELLKEEDGENENLVTIRIKNDGSWKTNSYARFIHENNREMLTKHLALVPGDVVVLGFGENISLCKTLGKLRLRIAEAMRVKGRPLYGDRDFRWLWVEDFPLFQPINDDDDHLCLDSRRRGLKSAHHPFSAPHPDDERLLFSEPLLCRGLHYDLVLNGTEVGGGSIRIHDADVQRRVLEEILGVECEKLDHLLKALDSGCPPHGGIALGLDRLVAVLVGANSVRDVIAFPKSNDVKDLMSKSPAVVDEEELKYYNIQIINDG